MSNFQPPRDWDAVYTAADGYFFGEEPSQIARTALHWFGMLGGDPSQALALDLGCGEGRDTAFLAAAGLRVTSRDVSPRGLEKTQALLSRNRVPEGQADIVLEDVRDFAYPPDTYDLALAANVFQFLTPDEGPAHIARLKGATKPGGICALGVFSPAMAGWGGEIDGFFAATADQLAAFFPREEGWLLLDRTEYWTYRPAEDTLASFAYAIARKQILE